MADDQEYSALAAGEDEASRLLRKIVSPAEAQSLVMPPPDHPPASGIAESTPLTGSLAKPPSQAVPSRTPAPETTAPLRQGLAGYFATAQAEGANSDRSNDRSGDAGYLKVLSNGQVGYLPKANLAAARQIDRNLKVLDEA